MGKCGSCLYYVLVKNVSETCELLNKNVLAGRDIDCEYFREAEYCPICKKHVSIAMTKECNNCGHRYCKGDCFNNHPSKMWCY
jgi:hypothetical protein